MSNLVTRAKSTMEQVSTILPKTEDDKNKIFNIMMNPKNEIKDFINMEIEIKDIMFDWQDIVDTKDGTVDTEADDYVPQYKTLRRSIIIDSKGESYYTFSPSFANTLMTFMQAWQIEKTLDKPKKIKVVSVKGSKANRDFLSFELV